jgi:hypothetical protein
VHPGQDRGDDIDCLLRAPPGADHHRSDSGDAATSTAPAKSPNAETPTPKQHHDRNELQLP